VRLLVFVVLCVVLMVVDARFDALKTVRSQMGLVLTPFYWVADMPVRIWRGATEQIASSNSLMAENEKLKAEALLMQRRLQKLAMLTEQNVRLRELLNSAALVDDKVIVAELIGLDPNPFTHRILIDKGEKDGVFMGQPVLDASGLMGQVVEVLPYARAYCCSPTSRTAFRSRSIAMVCARSPWVPAIRIISSCVTWPKRLTSRPEICWSVPG